MVPFSAGLLAYFVMLALAVGALMGVIADRGASLLFKTVHRYPILNATLGAVGFVGGIALCAVVPYPQNTLYGTLPGGGLVSTTMNRYQHPYVVGLVVSIVLPIGHELYRTFRRR